jgi:hypothetical protein
MADGLQILSEYTIALSLVDHYLIISQLLTLKDENILFSGQIFADNLMILKS